MGATLRVLACEKKLRIFFESTITIIIFVRSETVDGKFDQIFEEGIVYLYD